MARSKYFDRLKQLDKDLPFDTDQELPNPTLMRQQEGEDIIASIFMTIPLWAIRLLQWLAPGIRLGPVRLLTRPDHVLEIINHPEFFQTPFGPEMRLLTGGRSVVLGMTDQEEHTRQKHLMLDAFQLTGRGEHSKVYHHLVNMSYDFSSSYLAKQNGEFNPIYDLFLNSMVEVCAKFYGLKITDRHGFVDNVLSMNALLFADMSGLESARKLGISGARGVHDTIDASISQAQEVLSLTNASSTPLEYLLKRHETDPDAVSIAEVKAVMIAMITGFLPATLIAQANILEILLNKPEARSALETAMFDEDDKAIQGVLLEALRFRPIRPGPPRVAMGKRELKTKSGRKVQIYKGDAIFAATKALMFDRRYVKNPYKFDPTRTQNAEPSDPVWLVYGPQSHFCLGAGISNAHMVGVFKALFSLPNLRRRTKMQRRGAYPHSIKLQYGP